MTRQHDLSVRKDMSFCEAGRLAKEISAKNRPQIACRQRLSNRTAILGMAIGYLGLVAILASTPIWSQLLLPYQSTHLACTEAGGSR